MVCGRPVFVPCVRGVRVSLKGTAAAPTSIGGCRRESAVVPCRTVLAVGVQLREMVGRTSVSSGRWVSKREHTKYHRCACMYGDFSSMSSWGRELLSEMPPPPPIHESAAFASLRCHGCSSLPPGCPVGCPPLSAKAVRGERTALFKPDIKKVGSCYCRRCEPMRACCRVSLTSSCPWLQERHELLADSGAVLGGPHDGVPSHEAGGAAGAGVPKNGQQSVHVHVHGGELATPRGVCMCVRVRVCVCVSFFVASPALTG